MEAFELILILLACVIVASVVEQFVKRISLPLVQIGIGLIVALLIPHVAKIHMESELFLVLFIAPLLFNEARESSKRELWDNLPSILSLAIGLVLITVLVVGFALNWLVPSVPLAAAFACAAALGPTDAAAVGALGQTVSLSRRQKILLSGESLINDASGVVCFQFAIAAAVTGTFSIAQASTTFAVLFFGGIAFGVIAGFAAFLSIVALRRRGFENNVVHVLYEVFTPFLVFLVAEELHVSGILAVVAAGLVMARHTPRLTTSSQARLNLVSNGFWEIIVYLINGAIFTLLGMQLPQAMSPTINGGFNPLQLIAIILAITSLVMLSRFAWVSATELLHREPKTGKRGTANVGKTLKDALVTTIAGPKGAVTLSIIFTIPLLIEGGAAFPERNFIIFVTAGVILCTLIIADLTLARLSPNEHVGATEDDIRNAEITVLQNTINELESKIAMGTHPEYEPATRSVLGGYRTRLNRARLETAECGDTMGRLIKEVREVQRKRAGALQAEIERHISKSEAAPYYALLRKVRSSVGHYEEGAAVGTKPSSLRGKYHALMLRLRPREVTDEKTELMYYQTCLFAIDMENAAIEHLENVAKGADATTKKAARALIDEYRSIEETLQERVGYTGEQPGIDAGKLFNGAPGELSEKFRLARTYSEMITAAALSIELDKIGELQAEGAIGEDVAQKLRHNVYVLQMNAEE
jgi:Na+/H+ antiporter